MNPPPSFYLFSSYSSVFLNRALYRDAVRLKIHISPASLAAKNAEFRQFLRREG